MRVHSLRPSTPLFVTFLSVVATCFCSQSRANVSTNVADAQFYFSIQPGSSPMMGSLKQSREKRSSGDSRRSPYTSEEHKDLLNKHNELRGKTNAADMLMMEWNNDLQVEAQRWADRCDFAHPKSPRKIGSFSYVGQNLYVSTHLPQEITEPVQLWYDEIKDYTYSTDIQCEPNKMCGHYTQVVWAKSEAVGCAIKYCDELSSVSSFSSGYLVVCEYGPGGNIMGRYPYQKGKACSNCPDEYKYCNKNLCSVRPYVGSVEKGTSRCVGVCFLYHQSRSLMAASVLVSMFASTILSYL